MQTETKCKPQKQIVQGEVKLARNTPLITVFVNKGQCEITTTILITMGLVMAGRTVSFIDLTEGSKFPSYMPDDEHPDVVIVFCFLDQAYLLDIFPVQQRINLLVIDSRQIDNQDICQKLASYSLLTVSNYTFYCVGSNVVDVSLWIKFFKNLSALLIQACSRFSLKLLGHLVVCDEVDLFEAQDYQLAYFRPALICNTEIIDRLIEVIDGEA